MLRQILMEYRDIYKERDSLKLIVEKLNLEKKLLQDAGMRDLREFKIKHELVQKEQETELKKKLLEITHQREILDNEHKSEIAILKKELMIKDEQYQPIMIKALETLQKSQQSFKEGGNKKVVRVINPKDINEFDKIMELINQEILILCDITSIANKDQQRFLDRVYGGVYGLKGKIKEVSNKLFLYVPKSFDLLDDSKS